MSLPNRDEALQQIRDFGLSVDHLQLDTSGVVRCKYLDKRKRNLDGFYQVWSMDGTNVVAGYFGSFYPYKEIINLKGEHENKFSPNQKIKFEQKIQQAKKQVSTEEPDLSHWGKASSAKEGDHPYLEKKQILPHNLRIIGNELLVPFQNRDGEIVGVQRILENGKKFMIKNSKMIGAYNVLEGSDIVAICEGFATSASIHQATGWTTVSCYSADNMKKVIGKFKTSRLIICADDDWETEKKTGKNTGMFNAKKLAKRYHCESVPPVFVKDRLTDWNDLHVSEGLGVVKTQLLRYVPKTFIQKIADYETQEEREQFLLDNSSLLAEYDSKDFSFLKNRIKENFRISKSFVDDCVKGEKSESELEEIEDAMQALESVRFDGKYYLKIEDDKMFSTTGQEVTLLLNIASDGSDIKKQSILNDIHKNKLIGETISKPIPFGKSHLKERIGKGGSIVVENFVSISESLDLRLAQLDDIEIDQKLITYIETNYPEVIDIWEASLARKFCHHKVAFTYLICNTKFGKNFFFELQALARTFHRTYQIEDFKGNSAEYFIEPVAMFIDEADKFPAHYKTNIPEYKRNYGGLTSLTLGMRILACANRMEDIDRGVDPQLVERIVKINPKHQVFDHQGIQQVPSQQMWEKYLINRLLNRLMEWSMSGDFQANCGDFFQAYVDKYKFDEYVSLEDVLYDNLGQLMEIMVDGDRMREFGSGSFEFSDHLHQTDSKCGDEFLITSPKRFCSELFKYFDESRMKAFTKKYSSMEELSEVTFFDQKVTKCHGKTKRGFVFSVKEVDGITIIAKNVTESVTM